MIYTIFQKGTNLLQNEKNKYLNIISELKNKNEKLEQEI